MILLELKIPKLLRDQDTLNTGSSSTLSLAASWLENCIKNHSQCMDPRGNSCRPPTRLIDVGASDGSQNPCLCLTVGCSVPVQYMTLSHRWGLSKHAVLTTASLSMFSREIEVSKLPKSYRDAIAITRSLGIRYLWIDSLCIIQDSIADWQAESAAMGDIYKNSYCTIAAS